MIVVDEEMYQEIKSYLDVKGLAYSHLSSFIDVIPNNEFNVFFVLGKNLTKLDSLVVDFDKSFAFVITDDFSSLKTDLILKNIENSITLSTELGLEHLKHELDLFFCKDKVVKNLLYSVNNFYKDTLLNEISDLEGLEKKLQGIHQNLVPLRSLSAPNIKLFSKYSLGSDVGGEFVDFEKLGHDILIFMFSTNSYVLSGDLVELVLNLRQLKKLNYTNLKDSISKLLTSRKEDFDFIVMNINSRELKGRVIKKNYKLMLPKEVKCQDNVEQEFELESAQILPIFSPGMGFYTKKLNLNLSTIAEQDVSKSFNDVFSEVKSLITKGLGGPDATMLLIEVDKNAIKKL